MKTLALMVLSAGLLFENDFLYRGQDVCAAPTNNTGVDNVAAIMGSYVSGCLAPYLRTSPVPTVMLCGLQGRCLIQKMSPHRNRFPGLSMMRLVRRRFWRIDRT